MTHTLSAHFQRVTAAGCAAALMLASFGTAAQSYISDRVDRAATITDLVVRSGGDFDADNSDFDMLLNAVTTAGLEGALADVDADLTVFAPYDAAFIQLANDLGYEGNDEAGAFDFIVSVLTDLGEGDPIPVLTDILLYHVAGSTVGFYQVRSNSSIPTLLEGATVVPYMLQLQDNEPDIENASIVVPGANIFTGNGVLHTIDRVLLPLDLPGADLGTITSIVASSGGDFDANRLDFDILLNAVTTAELGDALADEMASLTLLAPNDRAFVALARDLGYEGFQESGAFDAIVDVLTELGGGDPIPLLTDILLYHVVDGALTAKQIVESSELNTLQGATIEPNGLSLIDNDPELANPRLWLEAVDLPASNGRVHTIGRILFPIDV